MDPSTVIGMLRCVSWLLTSHAVQRFQERVRDVPDEQAREQINFMLRQAEMVHVAPAWCSRPAAPQPTIHWRVFGDVAFLIDRGNIVLTVYTRGSLTPRERAARRRERRKRRTRGTMKLQGGRDDKVDLDREQEAG